MLYITEPKTAAAWAANQPLPVAWAQFDEANPWNYESQPATFRVIMTQATVEYGRCDSAFGA